MVPESLINGRSANAVVKERLAVADRLNPVLLEDCPTKQVRIALVEEERDKLHRLILEGKLGNLTEAIVALLADSTSSPHQGEGSSNAVSNAVAVLSTTLEALIPHLRNWSLEDLIKLQLELPLIIEQKKEACCDRRLEQAILYLASNCDHAFSQDGVGFNGADAGFGHWLATQVQQNKPLLQTHATAALKMVRKYIKQLEHGGLALPEWDAIAHQYAKNSTPVLVQDDEGVDVLPERRVEIKGERIAVYAPYDSSGKFQRDCKTIEGYKFEGEDKSWRFPLLMIEEVVEKLTNDQFYLTPEVEGAIVLARMQRQEEETAKEMAALAAADGIVQLVRTANLDAPLANGWYLRDYQKKGVEWLLAHRRGGIYTGGILADHMGLGKSLEALVAARAMQITHNCPVFVIAPVSVLENWVREAERAEVKIECFSWAKIPKPLDTQKYVLICDESHYMQNINSQRTKKALELAHHENCLTTWLLTGTPIKNGRPANLYPLLFAVNHPLGDDKWEYERYYCNAGHRSVGRGKSVWDNSGAAHLDELSQKTEDVILRRTKAECLTELPAKTRLFKEATLEASAAKSYQETIRSLVDDYRRRAKLGEVDENAEALVTLNILRKVGSEFKVEAARAITEELLEQGQQVVIFTEFVESAKAIASKLGGLLLTGDTKPEERQGLVDQFQSGENKVFVGTIKAGGLGLTLTAASNVILVDRAWSPGDCEQAEDRAHRLGQENAVFATWLQLSEIDKAIDSLLTQKQQRIELVLKGKRKTLQGIQSAKDLAKELLAIL
ncbi:MAG: DEAD/DEAH box helicase [Nostoc sp. NMS2]|nr:DEAD/DEAH box helicase [Nostoc sp. NMS2]